jgi:hypothetical protein
MTQFNIREGHCNVPKIHKEGGSNLGTWMCTQHRRKRNGRLNVDKKERLEEIGVVWSCSLEERWEHKFGLLKQFKNREGHCNVPSRYEEDGFNLGEWMNLQRQRKGEINADKKCVLKKFASCGVSSSSVRRNGNTSSA